MNNFNLRKFLVENRQDTTVTENYNAEELIKVERCIDTVVQFLEKEIENPQVIINKPILESLKQTKDDLEDIELRSQYVRATESLDDDESGLTDYEDELEDTQSED